MYWLVPAMSLGPGNNMLFHIITFPRRIYTEVWCLSTQFREALYMTKMLDSYNILRLCLLHTSTLQELWFVKKTSWKLLSSKFTKKRECNTLHFFHTCRSNIPYECKDTQKQKFVIESDLKSYIFLSSLINDPGSPLR